MVIMHPNLASIFKGKDELYPTALEGKYSRVFNNIMKYWGTPKCDEYFEDLIVDKRGGRQGFPPDVAGDIVRLAKVHQRLLEVRAAQAAPKVDPWKNEDVRRRLANEQIEYSMAGFWQAVESGNDRALKIFLQTVGVKPDEKDALGATALIKASMFKRTPVVAMLLEAGADANLANAQGLTPLHWAAFKGFRDIVELLLGKGAEAGVKGGPGVTPLMQAAMNGHAAICSQLLAKGANVNEPDRDGMTALHKAVSDGHPEVVRVLVEAGADREAKSSSGATALSIAERKKNGEILAALRA